MGKSLEAIHLKCSQQILDGISAVVRKHTRIPKVQKKRDRKPQKLVKVNKRGRTKRKCAGDLTDMRS